MSKEWTEEHNQGLRILIAELEQTTEFWGKEPYKMETKSIPMGEDVRVSVTMQQSGWQMYKHVKAQGGPMVDWAGIHEDCLKNATAGTPYDLLFADEIICHFCAIYPEYKPEDFFTEGN